MTPHLSKLNLKLSGCLVHKSCWSVVGSNQERDSLANACTWKYVKKNFTSGDFLFASVFLLNDFWSNRQSLYLSSCRCWAIFHSFSGLFSLSLSLSNLLFNFFLALRFLLSLFLSLSHTDTNFCSISLSFPLCLFVSFFFLNPFNFFPSLSFFLSQILWLFPFSSENSFPTFVKQLIAFQSNNWLPINTFLSFQ